VAIEDTTKAISYLDNRELDFVVANSMDIARGMARQVPLKLLYVMETLHDSEALVVHENWKGTLHSDIFKPRDLEGKIVGAWWGSSAHYSLQRFARASATDLMYDTRYQFNHSCGGDVPCFWENKSKAYLVKRQSPEDIKRAWEQEPPDIHAAYVGFPYLHDFLKKGKIMVTSELLGRWRMETFNGLVGHRNWLEEYPHPCMGATAPDHRQFAVNFVLEIAKASFYFMNNTKEFLMQHMEKKGVNQILADVVQGDRNLVYPHLMMYNYPDMTAQASKHWLGGGDKSRIVWALRDQAQFLLEIKSSYDSKDRKQRDENKCHARFNSNERGLADELPSLTRFASYVDTYYMDRNLADGNNGTYWLTLDDPAVPIQIGYGEKYLE